LRFAGVVDSAEKQSTTSDSEDSQSNVVVVPIQRRRTTASSAVQLGVCQLSAQPTVVAFCHLSLNNPHSLPYHLQLKCRKMSPPLYSASLSVASGRHVRVRNCYLFVTIAFFAARRYYIARHVLRQFCLPFIRTLKIMFVGETAKRFIALFDHKVAP